MGHYKFIKYLFVCSAFFLILPVTQAVQKESHPFPLNEALIKQIKKQGSALISDRVGTYILRSEGLASNKKYNQAIELLEYHYKRDTFTKSEKAQFAMQIGYLYKQNKNNEKSLSYLQEALDLKALPYSQHLSTLYNISLIYVEKENYDKALELLKLWFSINENPYPQAYILLAHCYYAKNQLKTALKYVEKTISLIGKPKESWLQFAVAIYLKQKEYKKAQPHLERLVALYPSTASHWKQLAGVYLYLDKTAHAFITLDMANKMGHLKSKNEYLNLFSLYIEQGMPYQGAKILKKKINQNLVPKERKNFELLAEAFWLAREEEEALIYLKEASKKAKKPLFFINYGQRLLDQEKWAEAEKSFKRALSTKEMQETIKDIQKYKKGLALADRVESGLNQDILSQAKNFKNKNNQEAASTDTNQTEEKNSTESAIEESENPNSKKTELLKAPPTNRLESIYLGIGIALYQQEKYEEALSYFKKSIEVDDTFLSGYQWIDYTETTLLDKQKKEKSTLIKEFINIPREKFS